MVVVGLLGAAYPLASQAPPPFAGWRTFDTPSFTVIFPDGLESMARRAAERGERALFRLEGFGTRPSGRIHLVVTDHMDFSNGFARIAPDPRIVIWARPPVSGPSALPFDDWLEFVVTHEVIHILHLETTSPLGTLARRIFGRPPLGWPFFPAFTLPTWALEGIAVAGESRLTDGGRIHGTHAEAVLRAAALDGTLDRLDQAFGTAPNYPGGDRPYLYGGAFHAALEAQFGADQVARWVRLQLEQVNPLRFDPPARAVFGASLDDLHEDWRSSVLSSAEDAKARVLQRAAHPAPIPLTQGARLGVYGAVSPITGALAYVRADGVQETALWILDPVEFALPVSPGPIPDPSPGQRGPRLHIPAPLSWAPDGALWTTQPDYVDGDRVVSDLWRLHPGEARLRQITHGLRATAVDVHPVNGRLLVVLEGGGTQELALFDPSGVRIETVVPPDPSVHWGEPRWSPDGTRIAVPRWRAGGFWAIALLSAPGSETVPSSEAVPSSETVPGLALLALFDEDRAPKGGVAWSADGQWLVWSSERSGTSNIYGIRGDGGKLRQLTDAITAARFPAFTLAGDALIYASLSGSGWDLVRIPHTPDAGFEPLARDPRFEEDPEGRGTGTLGGMASGWMAQVETGIVSPWLGIRALRPRYVFPVGWAVPETVGGVSLLPRTLGVETGGADPIDRARWSARADLPLGGAPARWGGSLEGQLRLGGGGRPTLSGRFEQGWDVIGALTPPARAPVREDRSPDLLYAVARERTGRVAISFIRPRLRSVHVVSGSVASVRQDRSLLEAEGSVSTRAQLLRPARSFFETTLGYSRGTAHGALFAPGPERGLGFVARIRVRTERDVPSGGRGDPVQDASFQEGVVVFRRWIALWPTGLSAAAGAPPVLALRGAMGGAWGPGGESLLSVGGGGGGGEGVFGATWNHPGATYGVRGFERGIGRGDRAVGGTAELRVPVRVVHRGGGTRPWYLDRVAGVLFVEAAKAWVDGSAPGSHQTLNPQSALGTRSGTLASAGVEFVAIHHLLTRAPVTLRGGVAIPLRAGVIHVPGADAGVVAPRPGPSLYAGVGWSF